MAAGCDELESVPGYPGTRYLGEGKLGNFRKLLTAEKRSQNTAQNSCEGAKTRGKMLLREQLRNCAMSC
eukprot:3940003-Rhodomonas_salina.1